MTRDDVLALVASDEVLQILWKELQARDLEEGDSAHDLGHIVRVAMWTVRLVEETVSARLCVIAAILHDAVNLPKNSPKRSSASQMSADYAQERLPSLGLTQDEIDPVVDAILNHSFSRGATPRTRLGKALQDADRLEALGAVGIMRTAAVGGRMGADFADMVDPWAHNRELDDKAHSVDHFFTKLYTLSATMHHEAARAEGRKRMRFMSAFLRQLGEEWGEAPPTLPEE